MRTFSACKPLALLVSAALAAGLLVGTSSPRAEAAPVLRAFTVVDGLSIPWDLTWIDSLMIYNERAGRVWTKRPGAAPRRLSIPLPAIYANSEGGLLGMVADPQASTNKRFYTCQAVSNSGNPDVRVLRWRLTSDTTAVSDLSRPVVANIPVSSGRHSGCRLRFGGDGKLYVGTGDAAIGVTPQRKLSLGGKVLRVNSDGSIPADNPFYSTGGDARYVWTFGHRNVQGLALRPGTSQLWSAEHGPDRDDEVNLVQRGGNYGWNPVPGYNEAVPMTDTSEFPGAIQAQWDSGSPTVATSGASFITGSAWGSLQGSLAVGLLAGRGVLIVSLRPDGAVLGTSRLEAAAPYGRIRAVQMGPDGALYFTTSNGSNDRIVRVVPQTSVPSYRVGLDVSPVGVSAARSGQTIALFVRSVGDTVYVRRSTDDGVSWGAWTSAGVTSVSAPSVTSSAPGRADLVTRPASGGVVHTWYVNGRKAGQTNLGGILTAAPTISSVGDGTLDVLVRGRNDEAWRNHFSGGRWSGWRRMGGIITAPIGASANVSTKTTTLTVRGTTGLTYERTLTPTSNGSGWVQNRSMSLWSARAFGDTRTGIGRVGVAVGPDRSAVVDRGPLIMGVGVTYTSAPDVITRENGTWIMFGRSTTGSVWSYDARPGQYRSRDLGGSVR